MTDSLDLKKRLLKLLVFQSMSLRQAKLIFTDIIQDRPEIKKARADASNKPAAKQSLVKEHMEAETEAEAPTQNSDSVSPNQPPEVPSFQDGESVGTPWMKSMYRKLQKSIHPDKNKHVAQEATHIGNAMKDNDTVAALYSYYVYHDDCPIPDESLESTILTLQKEYVRLRKEFDNKPIDIILRSPQDKWNKIFDICANQ